MAYLNSFGKRAAAFGVSFAVFAVSGIAQAQTIYSNSASYNAGYGRTPDQENQMTPVPTMRDANGNLVIVDGIIQSGADLSTFAGAGVSGAGDVVAGVGASGSATAFGNNLTVVTQGSNNTVIVNSKQTNTGNVSASSSLNGGVSNAQ